ncbi:MAG: methyltransferase [Bacillales bacterium]|jgi:SAM-dependent methyltransferase|nr:methyltransferase [Bacillales bacterium]
MSEKYYDKLLHIQTCGDQEGFPDSYHYNRYEPTPYAALEKLFEEYELKRSDRIVDFGCGKGRLNFFIHYLFEATVVGIEMNETFYQAAVDNREEYLKKYRNRNKSIYFQCCKAEEYEIDLVDNRFYFFNPFSIQIFMKIIQRILHSVEQYKRKIELVLYYPSNDYIYFLQNKTNFILVKEVGLSDLFNNQPNERFLIYQLDF